MKNNKEELFKQLQDLGEVCEHSLLEGFDRVGWVTDVYPSLEEHKELLLEEMCDYHIFENQDGIRIMRQHTSNNWGVFICEGSEDVVREHIEEMASKYVK